MFQTQGQLMSNTDCAKPQAYCEAQKQQITQNIFLTKLKKEITQDICDVSQAQKNARKTDALNQ